MMLRVVLALVLANLLPVFAVSADKASLAPAQLRTEYAEAPLAVESATPRFSWILQSPDAHARDLSQQAYQILVTAPQQKAKRTTVWDSGRVESSNSVLIPYAGPELKALGQYGWQVRAWDNKGQPSGWSDLANFTIAPRAEDWKATWIESPEFVQSAHNGYLSKFEATADSTKWVSVDLLKTERIEIVKLYPASPIELKPPKPGYVFPVRFRVDVSQDPKFSTYDTVVDQTKEDFPNPGVIPVEFHFAARNGRYVRLVVTRLAEAEKGKYGFALAEMEVLKNLPVPPFAQLPLSHGGVRPSALDSQQTGAWSIANLNDDVVMSVPARAGASGPATYFRKAIQVRNGVKSARLYATALGIYEVQLNGKKVGKIELAPEWTDYNTRVQYQTYDVTNQLVQGNNAIGIVAADGWYAGRIAFLPGRRYYGDKPRVLAQLRVEYTDGTQETFATDSSWKVTTAGPILSADLFDGEVYDARREMSGWDTSSFDDSSWKNVAAFTGKTPKVVSQYDEPIEVLDEVKPIGITEPTKGVYVIDMGQNMVGHLRVRFRGPAGTRVSVRHAEVLEPDGTIYTDNLRQNLQGAAANDVFILRGTGSDEEFEPRFTFHGFRYAEITGLDYRPSLDSIVGRVIHSAVPDTGKIDTSNAMINKLMSNIHWTQIGNLTGIPTDCPQRSERAGWTGDAQIISQTAIFNNNMARFYSKWLQDVRDAQGQDGSIFPFAPSPIGPAAPGSSVPGWSDATVTLAWTNYVNYGDKEVLKLQLESAKRYVDSVVKANPDLIWRKGRSRGTEFGDWLNGDSIDLPNWPRLGAATPMDLFSTAMLFNSTQNIVRMAQALGNADDVQKYADLAARMKSSFQREFVRKDGSLEAVGQPDASLATGAGTPLRGDTQTAYVLALNFGLLPPELEKQAIGNVVKSIEQKYDGHLSTGIHGTYRAMLELSGRGYNDVAYKLLMDRRAPSWGYMIDHGATTVWERWDSYIEGRGYQAPFMNSFNHAAFGAVGEWIYRVVGGINPDPAKPGFEHFFVRPMPGADVTWSNTKYESIRGLVEASWKKTGTNFSLNVSVPPNTSATIYLPTHVESTITESGSPLSRVAGVKAVRAEGDQTAIDVGSGTYSFAVAAGQ